jgi:hypothetical protein
MRSHSDVISKLESDVRIIKISEYLSAEEWHANREAITYSLLRSNFERVKMTTRKEEICCESIPISAIAPHDLI